MEWSDSVGPSSLAFSKSALNAFVPHRDLANMTWLGDGPLIAKYMRQMVRFLNSARTHLYRGLISCKVTCVPYKTLPSSLT